MGSSERGRSPNSTMRRSFSTPDGAHMQRNTAEESQVQSGEKKRNKLGYHRTSIACSEFKKVGRVTAHSMTNAVDCRPLSTKENTMHRVA